MGTCAPFSARTCTRQPVGNPGAPDHLSWPLCDEGCGAREAISIRPVDYGKKRWKKVAKKARAKLMQEASRKYWDSLSPEERSKEMKRRAKVRAQKRRSGK
jgi:hypothetical protein